MAIEHREIQAATEDTRHGTDLEAWTRAFRRNLYYFLGRFPVTATTNDKYQALAYSVREHLLDRWVKTAETYYSAVSNPKCNRAA